MKEESGKQHKQHLHAALRRHVQRQRVGCKRLRVEGIGGILDGQRPRALIDPRAVENAVVERLQVAERVQFRNKTCERLSNAAHGACTRRYTSVFGAVLEPVSTACSCFVV